MFKKIKHKVCQNSDPKACPKVGQPQPKGLTLCDCGMRLNPVYEPNKPAIIAAAAIGIVLFGVGGYFLSGSLSLSGLTRIVAGWRGNGRSGGGDYDRRGGSRSGGGLRYAIETENGLIDEGGSISSGGRLRFRVRGENSSPAHVYVFYENRDRDQMELVQSQNGTSDALDSGEDLVVPSRASWITFDNQPGREVFVMVVAPRRLDQENLDRVSRADFNQKIDSLAENLGGRAKVTKRRSGDWVQLVPEGKGLVLTRLELKHE